MPHSKSRYTDFAKCFACIVLNSARETRLRFMASTRPHLETIRSTALPMNFLGQRASIGKLRGQSVRAEERPSAELAARVRAAFGPCPPLALDERVDGVVNRLGRH